MRALIAIYVLCVVIHVGSIFISALITSCLLILFLSVFVKIFQVDFTTARTAENDSIEHYFNSDEQQCLNEFSLNKEYIRQISRTIRLPDDNGVYNRYIECLFKRLEFQDRYGNIHYSIIRDYLQKEVPKAIVLTAFREFIVKQAIRQAVGYCRNNEAEGNNDGQVAVRAWICILNKLDEAREHFRL